MLSDSRSAAGRAVLSSALIAALATYAWRGWYSRYVTDDYCTASELRSVGFLEAMKFHRQVWSGRFSYFAIKAALESAGEVTARFTPALMIVLLLAASLWTIRRLVAPGRAAVITAALAVTFAIIDSSPSLTNIGGAWFWETGALTYVLPLVLITAWLGLFGTDRPLPLACTASALLLFVAGGLSETSLAAQGALAGGVFVAALLFRARRQAWIAAAGILATLLALAIVATAPGNTSRVPALPRGSILATGLRAAAFGYRYLGNFAFVAPGLLLAIAGGFIAGWASPRLRPRIAAAAALIAAGAYVVAFLPAAWLIPHGPPERALDIPNYFLILALFSVAAAGGGAVRERSRASLITAGLLAASIVPLSAIVANVQAMPELRRTAARMDALAALLRESGGKAVVIHERWPLELRYLDRDAGFFTNRCVSRYYGLLSLRVQPATRPGLSTTAR